MICEKCGKEIADGVLVCGYCGHAVPKNQLSEATLDTINKNERSDESLKPNRLAGLRAFGIALMIIGGICDLVCIGLVGSGSFESFSTVTIIGTIAFFVGLFFTFAFRG